MAPEVFVGRAGEVALLRSAVARVAAGRGGSVLVEGEPGIGKSALLAQGLADAPRLGCQVFRCTGDASWQRLPLRALVDGLGFEIAELSDEDSLAALGGPADPVAAMVERLLDRVDRLCAEAPAVLVLDDLHWADEASALVWHRLSRAVDQLPLLLVAAGRPVPRRPELAALRRALLAGDTTTLTVGPLPESDVTALVEDLVQAGAGPGLRRYVAGARGNPLFVRESVAALQREQALHVSADIAELTGPAPTLVSLAGAIRGRLRILSPGAADLVRLAAILGTEFTVTDLATVTGRPATALTAAVDEALAAGVLAESGARLAFRHPLIHQALRDSTSDDDRAVLHRRAAHALAAAGAPPERVAQQLLDAHGRIDDWILAWLGGAATTLTARAPQVAADLLDRALVHLPADHPDRERLATRLITVLRLLARYDDVEHIARPLLAHTTDPEHAGQIAWTLAYAMSSSGRYEQALTVTQEALSLRSSADRWTARLRGRQAVLLDELGRSREADIAARQAIEEGEQLGDRFAVSFGLHARYLVADDSTTMLELLDRALTAAADDPESADLRIVLHSNLAKTLIDLGQMAEAERVLREGRALADRTGTPRLGTIQSRAGQFYFQIGRWDDAVTELEAALETLDDRPITRAVQLRVHGLRALIAGRRENGTVMRTHLAMAAGLDFTDAAVRASVMHHAMALAEEQSGRVDVAVAILRPMLTPGYATDFTARYYSMPMLMRLAIVVGDTALARAAAQACTEDANRYTVPIATLTAGRCRGLLDADASALQFAADGFRTAGDVPALAETLEDLALVCAQRGDTETARAAYAEAVDIYQSLDAAWDLERARIRLHPYGIGGTPRRTRPTHGWYALTPTERRIAHLVGSGLSNPDIATELFLSRRTVQSHVSHILAKLGARSRTEVARELARHGGPTAGGAAS